MSRQCYYFFIKYIFIFILISCGGGSSNNVVAPIIEEPDNPPQKTTITVNNTFPLNKDNNIPLNTSISVFFTQEVEISETDINVELSANNVLINGSISIEAQSISFVPSTDLEPSTLYTIRISPSESSIFNFQTLLFEFITEQRQLKVDSHLPLNQEKSVALNTDISLFFEEKINFSATDINFSMSSNDVLIEGSLSIKEQSILFTPSVTLEPNTHYSITISANESIDVDIQTLSFEFTTKAKKVGFPDSFFPDIKEKGITEFTLAPSDSVKEGELTLVSFGIPFPKGYLNDFANFQIFDIEGNEVPLAIKNNLIWQADQSIRSVLVQLTTSFTENEYGLLQPNQYLLKWGAKRSNSDLNFIPVRETWHLVNDDEFNADDGIYEPAAYAVFQPKWYGESVIKNRLLPFGSNDNFSASDVAFQLFGNTAINNVDPRVREENLLPFKTSYAAWLFDRATTLYQLAFKSGEFKFLRSAHRAAQFYLQHINEQGYFSLKPSNDLKYSYGESLVTSLIITGDERIPDIIKKMVPAWDSFKTDYTLSSNFWTERHAAYQLLGFISAYEVFGTDELKNKAQKAFLTLRKMQIEPEEGIPITGGLMHTAASHSEGGDYFIASPWMSVILTSAIERYYLNFPDLEVNDFVIKLADFFMLNDTSLYEWKGYDQKSSYMIPYYLAGIGLTEKQHGGDALNDLEHAHDVTKIFALAYFFSCQTECNEKYLDTVVQLKHSATSYGFPYWIRTATESIGHSAFRLAPPRKFNWWFQHSANNNFLIGENTKLPFHKPSSPAIEIKQSNNFDAKLYKPGDEITFKYKVSNLSDQAVKNIVILTKIIQSSPADIFEFIDFDEKSSNRTNAIAWKIERLDANEELDNLFFTIKVNDLPTLQSAKRPIGHIVSYANVHYCNISDENSVCITPTSSYDLGVQTLLSQSNWEMIEPIKPITPPKISIDNLFEGSVVEGNVSISTRVEDIDGLHHVALYLDGVLVKTFKEISTSYIYSLNSDALSSSEHVFTVKAFDIYGSEAVTNINFFAKKPDIEAPEITILSPVDNTSVCNEVLLSYRVEDNFNINSCMLTLDGIDSKYVECTDFKLSPILPLFSATSVLSFEEENNLIKSSGGKAFTGEGINIVREPGFVNNGLSFNTSQSYVDFHDGALDVENDLTISFWIKPSISEGIIMSQDWYYIGIERGWAITLGPNNHESNNELSIGWSSGNNRLNLNTRNVVQTLSNTIALEQWQHVVIRKKDTLIEIFIDGNLSISQHIADATIAWPYDSDKIFSLGKAMKHPDMYNKYYQGLLDEVAIWNKALSNSEIDQIHTRNASMGIHKMAISAIDNAGNLGSTEVNFEFKSCQ